MKQNHRGQTLVLFILLLPVFVLVLGFLIDIGYLHIEKRKVDYAIQSALEYGMKHKEDSTLKEDLQNLLVYNLYPIESSEVEITKNEITIMVSKKIERLLPFLFSEKETKIVIQKTIRE